MSNRSKNVKRNIVWGALNSIVAIFLPFVTRTAIIYTIGIEYAGLNSLFTSVLQVLSFAELGVGSAMAYSMYKPIAENNNKEVCALLNFYRKCYRIIGAVIFVCGIALLPFIECFIAGGVPDKINIFILFIIYLLDNIAGYMFYAYKTSLISACQRTDITSRITIIVQLVKSFLQIVALVACKNYYLYVLAILISTILNNMVTEYVTRKEFPYYYCQGEIEKEKIREIKGKVGGMLFQKIGSIILSSADTIVISSFLGLKILGMYNGYYYIITALTSGLAILHRSLIPSVGNSVVGESKDKNYRDFKKFHFLYIWIVGWCSVCLLCMYQPFMRLWQGEENMLTFSMVILFAAYFFVYHVGDMSHIYKEALGLWWEGKFIPLISSAINLSLNLIMINIIGLHGILISTILSVVVVNIPFVAYVIFKYYFKSLKLWRNYLISLVYCFIITSAIAWLTYNISSHIRLDGVALLIAISIVCIIVPNILFYMTFRYNKDCQEALKFIYQISPNRLKKCIPKNFFMT